jgi:predicted acetyltransferase
MISANEDNPASWKTIERCGGIFDKIVMKDEEPLKLYYIEL